MESLYFIKDEHKSKKAPIGAFLIKSLEDLWSLYIL